MSLFFNLYGVLLLVATLVLIVRDLRDMRVLSEMTWREVLHRYLLRVIMGLFAMFSAVMFVAALRTKGTV